MLVDVAELISVHTIALGLQALERDGANVDLVICTVAFDESRMMEFLQAVKRRPAISGIPFLCMRVLPTILSDNIIESVRTACMDIGAVEFLDIAKLDREAGQIALRAAVVKYGARQA